MRKCAPGRGTSAAYRGSAYAYDVYAAEASQRLEMARRAAIARQMEMARRAANDAGRLAAADGAYKRGDVKVASRMYMAIARARGPAALEARRRLAQMTADAKYKLEAIEAKLEEAKTGFSPGELISANGPPQAWQDRVKATFDEYDQLAESYYWFMPAKRVIRKHLAEQRRQAEIGLVLKEPEAKALWETGQEHEKDGNLCCAYWVYTRAAGLTPAPSARRASERLAEMKEDPEILVAAKTCAQLQECHRKYKSAQQVIDGNPSRAKTLFEEIVSLAPEDSEVYQAAQRHIQEMR